MEPVARSPSIKIDLTYTELGQKQRQKITCLNRHKLRRLAIKQARDEQAYFRSDLAPERTNFAPTLLVKGTPIIELADPIIRHQVIEYWGCLSWRRAVLKGQLMY